MPKISGRNGNGATRNGGSASKYDAHHKVLSQTYGAFADLRRELSDSKTTVNEREDMLKSFATCPDSQRSWLLLEDYFEKLLALAQGFSRDTNWWPKPVERDIGQNATGRTRVFIFARETFRAAGAVNRTRASTVLRSAEEAEQEVKLVQELERWLAPSALPLHLDTPRATLRVVLQVVQAGEDEPSHHRLTVQFLLSRPRTGEKARIAARDD